MIDSEKWHWGQGYCELHRGENLPCQQCITTFNSCLVRSKGVETALEILGRGAKPEGRITMAEWTEICRQQDIIQKEFYNPNLGEAFTIQYHGRLHGL
jgi:hypothetical protein